MASTGAAEELHVLRLHGSTARDRDGDVAADIAVLAATDTEALIALPDCVSNDVRNRKLRDRERRWRRSSRGRHCPPRRIALSPGLLIQLEHERTDLLCPKARVTPPEAIGVP